VPPRKVRLGTMPDAPPAVVGLARYPTPDSIDVFLRSFVASRSASHLYLLIDRDDLQAWRSAESDVVHVLPVRHWWIFETNVRAQYALRRLLDASGALRLVPLIDRLLLALGRLPIATLFEQPHVSRLRHQAKLVDGLLRDAPWVFLTDTRDVVFQGPFEDAFASTVAGAPLNVYEEGIDLGSDGDLAGLPQVRALDPSASPSGRVLCVGTVLGTPPALATFLDLMLRVLVTRPRRYPRMLDQGALNLLYYGGKLDAVAHPLGDAGVLTCAVVADRVQVEDGKAHWDGGVPPVVHQFDRVPELEDAYRRAFSHSCGATAPASSDYGT
jgi:hypothetical protein